MAFLGNPEYEVDLQPIDFVKHAKSLGARGFRIEDPAECGRILDEALATPGPVVIEAVVDSNEALSASGQSTSPKLSRGVSLMVWLLPGMPSAPGFASSCRRDSGWAGTSGLGHLTQ